MRTLKNKNMYMEMMLTSEESISLIKSAGKLGENKTSKYFVNRTKSIVYFIRIENFK
ncbi:MAG: hypothetical protein HRT42_02035 [Campylobacteraceae bacterium]|nr:hypothetical protein [Campylobacteraceae bacterium]